MQMLDYLRILSRRWLVIAVCAILGLAATVAVTVRATPQYASSITLYVSSTDRTQTASIAYEASLFAQQEVQSYASLLSSERVARELSRHLADGLTPRQVQGKITASVIPQTALLRATVTDVSRKRVRLIASALGPVFANVVDLLEQPATGGPSPVRVTVVDDAVTPTAPVSPRRLRNLVLGLLAGLMAGLAAAVLREITDMSVKSSEMLRDLTGGPLLASVGIQNKAQRHAIGEHRSPRTEAYRSLRTNLQFVDVDRPVKVLTVTSSIAGEGKSLTACNLALTLADAGKRVILVDGDLRRPQVGEYLGIKRQTGLTSILVGAARLDQALVTSKNRQLSVLPAGPIPPNPSELLGSARMLELVELLKQDADFVVIDSPPLLAVTDAAILAHISDGALLVVQHGLARRDQVGRAVEQLTAVDARLLGSILNKTPARGPEADSYFYSYQGYTPSLPGAQLLGAGSGVSETPGRRWRPVARRYSAARRESQEL
jgi:non-specific protein-tyrosine kinase